MKTSPKRSYSVIENDRFGLVFAKTGSIISGTEKFRDTQRSNRVQIKTYSRVENIIYFIDLKFTAYGILTRILSKGLSKTGWTYLNYKLENRNKFVFYENDIVNIKNEWRKLFNKNLYCVFGKKRAEQKCLWHVEKICLATFQRDRFDKSSTVNLV